jgi:hypothetical protein
VETLTGRPDKSIWESVRDAGLKPATICRTLGNERFDREEIAGAKREAGLQWTAEWQRDSGYAGCRRYVTGPSQNGILSVGQSRSDRRSLPLDKANKTRYSCFR